MGNRVQIVVLRKGEGRWKFIAHGAPYTKDEAAKWVADYHAGTGDKVRLLPMPKGY